MASNALYSLLIFVMSQLFLGTAYDNTIYVDKSSPNAQDNTTCGNQSQPCLSLTYALCKRVLDSTQLIVIDSGEYSLDEVVNISNISNIAIIGVPQLLRESSQPTVTDLLTVTCTSGAGLSFVYCNNITLQNILFSGCGAVQTSTSRNFSAIQFAFMQFPVSLYFLFCQHINFTQVTITSSSGTGVAMYATGGLNYIHKCSFLHNRPPMDQMVPGGGGLFIEFPFCNPQAPEDCDSGTTIIPNQFRTWVEYKISECKFEDNYGHMWHPVEYLYLLPQDKQHLTFGHGGGLSVFFSHAENSLVLVEYCWFEKNEAEWGGGVFVEFQELSWNNSFSMDNCLVSGNTAYLSHDTTSAGQTTGGGGMKLGYLFIKDNFMGHNSMHFSNCTYQYNEAFWGGGVYFNSAKEESRSTASNIIAFKNCSWLYNVGRVGSAFDLSDWHVGWKGAIVTPHFNDCVFSGNNDYPSKVTYIGEIIGVGAINTESIPLYFNNYIEFYNNNRSALVVTDSVVHFLDDCIANFTKNLGENGGAIALFGSSHIRVYEYTKMIFISNSAIQFGGAIYSYVIGLHDLALFGDCFIQYYDPIIPPWNWTASFYFRGNIAIYSDTSRAIYGTSLLSCLWESFTKKKIPDPRKEIFCWSNKWVYDGNCKDQISSAPATFNNTQNNSSYQMEVILGKREVMPIEVLGDEMTNQTSHAIFYLWSHSPDTAQIPITSSYVSDNTIQVTGTPNSTAVVAVETIRPRVIYTELKINILPCPPAFYAMRNSSNSTTCTCEGTYGGVVICEQQSFSAYLRRGYWMGLDSSNQVIVGTCSYTPTFALKNGYIKLPNKSRDLESILCYPANRKGMFCGLCRQGYAPSINTNTFKCVKCTHKDAAINWIYYLLLEILPITIFFFVVVLFHISVTRGSANGFIFFAQLLTTTFEIDGDNTIPIKKFTSSAPTLQKLYEVPYGIWNLNFFTSVVPPFCLSPNLNTLGVLSLHYILAIYPLLLIVVFYFMISLYNRGVQPIFCLCKPVHRIFGSLQRRWNLNRSTIDAFSTFLVLSYTKFTVVSIYILTPTTVQDSTGSRTGRHVYFEGDVGYLSSKHIPYVTIALFVMITFVLLPPLILLVYPLKMIEILMQKLGCCWKFSKLVGVCIFS